MLLSPFETPLYVDSIGDDELCREVAARLVDESTREPSRVASVVGGWHGSPDIPARTDLCWRTVTEAVAKAVRSAVEDTAARRTVPLPALEYLAEGWGVVLRAGDYVVPHDHAASHWSAVWYADAGEPPPVDHPAAGALAFLDGRHSGAAADPAGLFPQQWMLQPETAMVVVFPGWLSHFVHPYRGQRPRVSVSFNVLVVSR